MRSAHLLCAALSWPLLAAHVLAAPPPLPAEHLTLERLPPRSPHWVYVYDYVFDNEIDARVYLFDGDSYRRLGQIGAGFYPSFSLSPDGGTTAVASTYFARGSRGARTDVVEFTDNTGCVEVIPSGHYRVSSICESGRLLTVTLDAQGHELARAMSEPFFDADQDPVFVQGIPITRGNVFLSFLGEVHEIDFSGAQPQLAAPWSLVSAAEKGAHWRPGAYQVGAIHRELGRLYV